MLFWFNFTIPQDQISTHTQMYQEIVIFQLENQVFCAPRDRSDLLPLDLFLEFFNCRGSQGARPEHIGIQNGFADEFVF